MENKQRLIDANALIDALEPLEARGGHEYYRRGANMVLHKFMPKLIAAQPTVDAVLVVRCKDCKFWQESVDGINKWCPLLRGKETNAYDFCSYGERRNPNG